MIGLSVSLVGDVNMTMYQLLRQLDQNDLFDLQNQITQSDLSSDEKEILRSEIHQQLSERALVRMMTPIVKDYMEKRNGKL